MLPSVNPLRREEQDGSNFTKQAATSVEEAVLRTQDPENVCDLVGFVHVLLRTPGFRPRLFHLFHPSIYLTCLTSFSRRTSTSRQSFSDPHSFRLSRPYPFDSTCIYFPY